MPPNGHANGRHHPAPSWHNPRGHAAHVRSLPGIDIAFVLDSTAYHSYLDTPERLRPGNLQEMGEDLMGGLYSVAEDLHQQHAQGARKSAVERAVFFDVLGYFMVGQVLRCFMQRFMVDEVLRCSMVLHAGLHGDLW